MSLHYIYVDQPEEVINMVNAWAKKETKGLIDKLISPDSIEEDTRLIFANALYFKGGWKDKFPPLLTRKQNFHLLNGEKVQVYFMSDYETHFVNVADDFKVLGLPYKQGDDERQFSMYLFLPDEYEGLALKDLALNPGL